MSKNPKLLTEIHSKLVNKGWEKNQSRRASEIIKLLGEGMLITELDETHIEHLCTTLDERGLTGSTINRYLASLSKMLRYANERKAIYHLDRVPFIEWRAENKARIRFVLPEEEKEMIEVLTKRGDTDYLNFFLFLMDTGMRLSEAHRLCKRDVQISNDGQYYITLYDTKNGDDRGIPLTKRAKKIVADLIANKERKDSIFALNYWSIERVWREMREIMGLENDKQFVIHCLRHTFASRLAQSGSVEMHIIGKLLGHRSYAMTQRYSHLRPTNLVNAIDVLDTQAQSAVG